jgi:Protein phosphatase 2C
MVSFGMWRYAAAKTTGTSHSRENLPCQDSFRCQVISRLHGSVLVVVVSDGAGSAVESARGSALICEVLSKEVAQSLPDAIPSPGWLKGCVSRTRESLVAEAETLGIPPRQLAATLLCAVLTEQWSAFAQVGDGAIVTRELGTDSWAWLFWPQRGEYANTTSFLTDPNALDVAQIDTLPHAQDEVALFTDGIQHLVLHYEEQSVHSPFFERMMAPVRKSEANGEDPQLSAELVKYLGSDTVTSRADDDLTLVLACRTRDG